MCPQTKNRLISLKKFYVVSGSLKCSLKKELKKDTTKFEWNEDDQGTIRGNIIKLREILLNKSDEFGNLRIETETNYKWRNCNQKMTRPCPYYYTAIASLVAPIVLALATISIIICLSKCCKQGNLIDLFDILFDSF